MECNKNACYPDEISDWVLLMAVSVPPLLDIPKRLIRWCVNVLGESSVVCSAFLPSSGLTITVGHFLDIYTDFRPVAHMTIKHVHLHHIATIIPGVL